jgi:hypothetical protein
MGSKASSHAGSGLSRKEEKGIQRAGRKSNELNKRSAAKLQYDVLQPGWIRVLYLKTGSGTEPVICSLSAEPLETPLPFEAVSYAWGDLAATHQITCNWLIPTTMDDEVVLALPTQVTNNFQVTQNLYQLLVHLRDPNEPRRLWIDKICVDQSNPEEKGEQIRLMAQLYAQASNVLIWLGEEDDHTEAAFGFMDFLVTTNRLSNEQLGEFIDWFSSMDEIPDTEKAAFIDQMGAGTTVEDLEALKATLTHVRPFIVAGL